MGFKVPLPARLLRSTYVRVKYNQPTGPTLDDDQDDGGQATNRPELHGKM